MPCSFHLGPGQSTVDSHSLATPLACKHPSYFCLCGLRTVAFLPGASVPSSYGCYGLKLSMPSKGSHCRAWLPVGGISERSQGKGSDPLLSASQFCHHHPRPSTMALCSSGPEMMSVNCALKLNPNKATLLVLSRGHQGHHSSPSELCGGFLFLPCGESGMTFTMTPFVQDLTPFVVPGYLDCYR